jgi:hypothetical protein
LTPEQHANDPERLSSLSIGTPNYHKGTYRQDIATMFLSILAILSANALAAALPPAEYDYVIIGSGPGGGSLA